LNKSAQELEDKYQTKNKYGTANILLLTPEDTLTYIDDLLQNGLNVWGYDFYEYEPDEHIIQAHGKSLPNYEGGDYDDFIAEIKEDIQSADPNHSLYEILLLSEKYTIDHH